MKCEPKMQQQLVLDVSEARSVGSAGHSPKEEPRAGMAGSAVGRKRTRSEMKLCKDGRYRMIPRARNREESVADFWRNVEKRGFDDCWRWIGDSKDNGNGMVYGKVWNGKRSVPAHRFSYELHNGAIPPHPKALVCHRCDNTICVNPSHLFLGSYKDNNLDSFIKGRKASCKLTAETVAEIKRDLLNGVSRQEVAQRYGTTDINIGYIHRGESWKHVKAKE